MRTGSTSSRYKLFLLPLAIIGIIVATAAITISVNSTARNFAIYYFDSIANRYAAVSHIAYTLGLHPIWEAESDLGDGGLATNATFKDPTGIYVDAQGRVYISERRRFRIRRVENGQISTVAGNGIPGYSGDKHPATQVRLSRPEGIDGDAQGNIYFADSFNHRIRRITAAGVIETVAGTGEPGYSGDGGPATQAQLDGPMDVKIGPSGNIYILERDNHSVRRINKDGIIETIAGNGKAGFKGDGGPSNLSQLNIPYGIAVDRLENIYIADSANNRVRKISARDATITTIAGNGIAGFSGDDGPASLAQMDSPQAITILPDQQILVNDEHNHRIRKITHDGQIQTVIGTGKPGFSGDGGKASVALLNDPEYIWADKAGVVYVTDGDNNRVRRITKDGIISTFAGGGKKH